MLERFVSPKNMPFLLSAVLFLFAFLLYQNTVPNGYTLDDTIYYQNNKFVQQGLKGIKGIFTKSLYFGFNGKNDQIYRPLPVAFFAVQHSIKGNNPHFNHFVNVFAYAFCCSLLFFLLRLLFTGGSPAIPFCITLLFTAHPVHTEVVASIKGLDEILAFLFFVLTLLFILYHHDNGRRHPGFLAASVISFLLCLLCKEHGLTLLGILPVTLYTFRHVPARRIVLLMLPFCLAALLYIVFRNSILDHFTFEEPLTIYQNALMAADNQADRLATAFVILGKYLRLLFVPYPLCWDYSYNQIPATTWADPKAFFPLIVYSGMLAAGLIGTVKKSPAAFASLFFLMSFSLSSNLFLKIGVTLGERLLFIPSLGFCMAMVLLFSKATLRTRFQKPLAAVIMASVVAAYSVIIINRNPDWKDNFTLFSGDIAKNPGSSMAHNYLGAQLLDKKNLEKDPQKKSALLYRAIDEFRHSVRIYPDYLPAWCNLGDACNEAGELDSAIAAYRKTLELNPRKITAAHNIGTLYYVRKNYDSSARYFEKALDIDPNNVVTHLNLGAINLVLKNYSASIASYKKAIGIEPHNQYASDGLYRLAILVKDTALAAKYRPQNPGRTGPFDKK